MLIKRPNPFKRGEFREREIDVTEEQLRNWAEGALIQDAMPHLFADDREFIMTGMTQEDWEALGEEE